jgi:RNA polymerase sigma-70 factor (ECF subfamily)
MTGPAASCETTRLFRAYAGDVGRWAARLSGSPGDADDIVQEVFLTVHRQRRSLEELRSPPGWLMQITRNVVRHVWRTRGRAARRAGTCDLDAFVAPEPDPHQALERRRAMQEVHAALDALDEGHRQVCWLSDIQELPPATVGALTGLGPEALRVRRFRARRKLAVHLTPLRSDLA